MPWAEPKARGVSRDVLQLCSGNTAHPWYRSAENVSTGLIQIPHFPCPGHNNNNNNDNDLLFCLGWFVYFFLYFLKSSCVRVMCVSLVSWKHSLTLHAKHLLLNVNQHEIRNIQIKCCDGKIISHLKKVKIKTCRPSLIYREFMNYRTTGCNFYAFNILIWSMNCGVASW